MLSSYIKPVRVQMVIVTPKKLFASTKCSICILDIFRFVLLLLINWPKRDGNLSSQCMTMVIIMNILQISGHLVHHEQLKTHRMHMDVNPSSSDLHPCIL